MGFKELERYIKAYKEYMEDYDSYLYKVNRDYLLVAAEEGDKVLNLIESMVDAGYDVDYIFEILEHGNYGN